MIYFITEDSNVNVKEFWERLFSALEVNVCIICANGNKNVKTEIMKHFDDIIDSDRTFIQYDIREDLIVDDTYRNTCILIKNLGRLNHNIKRIEVMCFEEFFLSFSKLLSWCRCIEEDKIRVFGYVQQCINKNVSYYGTNKDTEQLVHKYRSKNVEKFAKHLYKYFTEKTPFATTNKCFYESCCWGDIINPSCDVDAIDGKEKLKILYMNSELGRVFSGIEKYKMV